MNIKPENKKPLIAIGVMVIVLSLWQVLGQTSNRQTFYPPTFNPDKKLTQRDFNVPSDQVYDKIPDPNQNPIPITGVVSDKRGYGIPNVLQWEANNLEAETRYTVTIRNVKVNRQLRDFQYWFELT
ncbi:hypothetical protein [Acaryochloris sp. IP29b_bin.148]|uniref:hypothetical protein n=1 Tax=Acaryochloris sp. IP29b_bin.148 TaxID=2969218 RepID=UPI0026302CF6|nr:hypothetical protein [Acaryochloris sp. IP29b_bin.148]